MFVAVAAIIVVGAFWSGFGIANLEAHTITTYTTLTTVHTNATFVQISGSNHSVFYVTEEAIVEPEFVNEICIIERTNTTVDVRYILPTEGLNGSNPIGFITTSISYENSTTTTIYENVTMISDGITCTLINPHYGTQPNSCPPCV